MLAPYECSRRVTHNRATAGLFRVLDETSTVLRDTARHPAVAGAPREEHGQSSNEQTQCTWQRGPSKRLAQRPLLVRRGHGDRQRFAVSELDSVTGLQLRDEIATCVALDRRFALLPFGAGEADRALRSEEHTSEL